MERTPQGSPHVARAGNELTLPFSTYDSVTMNPKARQSPLPLRGAEVPSVNGPAPQKLTGSQTSELKEPRGPLERVGKLRVRDTECPDQRPRASSNLTPGAGIDPGVPPVGIQAE